MMPHDVWSISDALIATDLTPDEEAIDQRLIAAAHLDYSLASLTALEGYLDAIRVRGWDQLTGDEKFSATVFRVGAYVGEVVRRRKPQEWCWVDDSQLTRNPRLAEHIGEPNIETALTLLNANGTATWPVSRVLKYLGQGSDESISQYATWLLTMQTETASC